MDTSLFNSPTANAWLNLSLTPGIGPKTLQYIGKQTIKPEQVYELDSLQLKALGISQKSITHLQKYPPTKPSKEVETALLWACDDSHYLLTLHDEYYPNALRQIATPPPLLMVKGQIIALQIEQLAIVGSRYPTPSGDQQAYDMATQLTDMGLAITSGMALGIDASAHRGALHSGGTTLAVLGSGLNHIYPKQNQKLSEEITEKGALISEFSLSSRPHPGHFPRRNRIVSGLSMGTLVIEATLKSGSLITARQALEQNREVFAMPGSVSNPQKAGCHYLIRQGATLVESAEHIAQELRWQHDVKVAVIEKETRVLPTMNPSEQKLIKALDYDGANLDEIVARTHMPVSELNVVLMELELNGIIRQDQGSYSLI